MSLLEESCRDNLAFANIVKTFEVKHWVVRLKPERTETLWVRPLCFYLLLFSVPHLDSEPDHCQKIPPLHGSWVEVFWRSLLFVEGKLSLVLVSMEQRRNLVFSWHSLSNSQFRFCHPASTKDIMAFPEPPSFPPLSRELTFTLYACIFYIHSTPTTRRLSSVDLFIPFCSLGRSEVFFLVHGLKFTQKLILNPPTDRSDTSSLCWAGETQSKLVIMKLTIFIRKTGY